jgi:hypothetical protein
VNIGVALLYRRGRRLHALQVSLPRYINTYITCTCLIRIHWSNWGIRVADKFTARSSLILVPIVSVH